MRIACKKVPATSSACGDLDKRRAETNLADEDCIEKLRARTTVAWVLVGSMEARPEVRAVIAGLAS